MATQAKGKGVEKISENELLQFLLKRDNIDLNDVLKDMDAMKRDKILEQHKKTLKYGKQMMDVGKQSYLMAVNMANW